MSVRSLRSNSCTKFYTAYFRSENGDKKLKVEFKNNQRSPSPDNGIVVRLNGKKLDSISSKEGCLFGGRRDTLRNFSINLADSMPTVADFKKYDIIYFGGDLYSTCSIKVNSTCEEMVKKINISDDQSNLRAGLATSGMTLKELQDLILTHEAYLSKHVTSRFFGVPVTAGHLTTLLKSAGATELREKQSRSEVGSNNASTACSPKPNARFFAEDHKAVASGGSESSEVAELLSGREATRANALPTIGGSSLNATIITHPAPLNTGPIHEQQEHGGGDAATQQSNNAVTAANTPPPIGSSSVNTARVSPTPPAVDGLEEPLLGGTLQKDNDDKKQKGNGRGCPCVVQ